jgi:glycosyltransferase involved in cell wall biosynthesis
MPLLTVAVPTLNGASFIRETLTSVISQMTDDLEVEIVIMENHSTDQTIEICREFEEKYPFIRSVYSQSTVPFDQNVARAVHEASGTYVWILADDDVLVPGSLNKVHQSLKDLHPAVLLVNFKKVGEDLSVLDEEGEVNETETTLSTIKVFEKAEDALAGASFDIFGLLSAIVVNREKYLEYGSKVDFGLPEGFDFLYIIPRLMQTGTTVFLDDRLVLFRQYKKRWETTPDYSQSMNIFFLVIPSILHQLAKDGFSAKLVSSLQRRHLANLTFHLIIASRSGMGYRGSFLRKLVAVNYRNTVLWIQVPVFFLPKFLLERLLFLYEGKVAVFLRNLI